MLSVHPGCTCSSSVFSTRSLAGGVLYSRTYARMRSHLRPASMNACGPQSAWGWPNMQARACMVTCLHVCLFCLLVHVFSVDARETSHM